MYIAKNIASGPGFPSDVLRAEKKVRLVVQVWFTVGSAVTSTAGVASVGETLGTSVGSSTVDVGVGVVSGGVSCVHPAIRTRPAMQSTTKIKHIVLFIAAPPCALSCEYPHHHIL